MLNDVSKRKRDKKKRDLLAYESENRSLKEMVGVLQMYFFISDFCYVEA